MLGRGRFSKGSAGDGNITKIDSNGKKILDKGLEDLSSDGYGPVYAIVPTSDVGYLLGRGRFSEGSAGDGNITKIDSNGKKYGIKDGKI